MRIDKAKPALTFVAEPSVWRGVLVDGTTAAVELPQDATEADALVALEAKFAAGETYRLDVREG